MVRQSLLKKKASNSFFSKKQGLSTVVITVLLIAVSMAAIVLVWGFASNLIQGQIKNSESCFGNFEKIKINKQYTCYEEIGTTDTYNLRFSLSIGEVAVDKIIVGVSSLGSIRSYELTNTPHLISGLSLYLTGTQIVLPTQNNGLTYITTSAFLNKPDSIEIASVIDGVQCDISDSVSEIADCDLMDFGE